MKFSGGPVMWRSKLQRSAALSSIDAAKLLAWLGKLLTKVDAVDEDYLPTLNVDILSAIKLMKNPISHERSKHIETRYHYVHQLLSERETEVKYISSEYQAADMFTKAMSSSKLNSMKNPMYGIILRCNSKHCRRVLEYYDNVQNEAHLVIL